MCTEIPPKARLNESQLAASYWYLVPLVSRSGIAPFRCSMLETQDDTYSLFADMFYSQDKTLLIAQKSGYKSG